ncbi:MAG: alanine racemase [Nitrospirota bacterium]
MAFGQTLATIDLSALSHNFTQVEKRVGGRKIIAVIKANAYGHGAIAIAKHLIKSSPPAMLAVASLDEAIILREAKIAAPILLLTGCPADRMGEVVSYRLTPTLFDTKSLAGDGRLIALSRSLKLASRKVTVHLKVDTGMGRLGIAPSQVVGFLKKAEDFGIVVEGILSHFAEADLSDLSFAKEQTATIKNVITTLTKKKGCDPCEGYDPCEMTLPFFHLANSAAILHFPEAYLDAVRPGLMLYGYSPLEGKKSFTLRPVMTIRSRVIAIKTVPANTSISYGRTYVTKQTTKVATIGIGYADGYPRALSNCGEMIAKGRRVPVIGRVCMDMTMLDVTKVPKLLVGDFVTVIGQEGKEAVWADDLAKKAGTIPYEILCGIKGNMPREYVGA